MNKMEGQFSIIKGYGNDQQAALFAVTNPHKAKGRDHINFTIMVRL